jgi:ribosome maturation factor RimP
VQARTELRRLLEPGVSALGFELVDIELLGQGRHATLRVYIDSPDGVNVDDCAAVSRQLSALLDVEDPLPGGYTLEVSSPGLDRPLLTPAHYRRFVGELVKLTLAQPRDGRRKFKGRLVEAGDDHVVIETEGVGGAPEQFRLAYADIERARLVPRFEGRAKG